ncbi:hypothetical protein [Flavobacterium sp.]|uniref:hypothetical protein n=1 Tax=Flavobacterium sp. TaxID=239 RepID=UPI0012178B57|nr:hypothetical protein [Flavobacterium sp.]RZJ69557.1 MAG: hypothetical protein EOO49_17200 [Flavobacterium sp.]
MEAAVGLQALAFCSKSFYETNPETQKSSNNAGIPHANGSLKAYLQTTKTGFTCFFAGRFGGSASLRRFHCIGFSWLATRRRWLFIREVCDFSKCVTESVTPKKSKAPYFS